jgi:hypothetical protein
VSFSTRHRKGLGISLGDLVRPFTKVSGMLASPRISLSAKEAVVERGAAVATSGLTFLTKKLRHRFLTAKDPCAEALADAKGHGP